MQYGLFTWRPWGSNFFVFGIMIPLGESDDMSISFRGPSPVNTGPPLLGMRSCFHNNLEGVAYKSDIHRSQDGLYYIDGRYFDEIIYLDQNIDRAIHFSTTSRYMKSVPSTYRNVTFTISTFLKTITVTRTVTAHQPGQPDEFWTSFSGKAVFMFEKTIGPRIYYKSGSAGTQVFKGQVPDWYLPPVPFPTLVADSQYEPSISRVMSNLAPLTEDEMEIAVASLITRATYSIPLYSEDVVFGDLSQECANQAKLLDINLSQYLYELTKIKSQVISTLQLLKGKASAKSLASLYLSAKYGYANTFRDTKAIVDALTKEMRSYKGTYTCRAQLNFADRSPCSTSSTWRTSFYQKIYYDQSWDDPLLDALQAAISSSIIPSLSDVWDYLPFSFVVNWFVNIESALAAVDAKTFIATLPIRAVIETRKDTTEIDLSLLSELHRYEICGYATYSRYRRELKRSARLPYARFGESNPSNHWVEGTALLLQARR